MFFGSPDFRPVVGRRFQFRPKPGPGWSGIIDAEILEVDLTGSHTPGWAARAPRSNTPRSYGRLPSLRAIIRLHLEPCGPDGDTKREIGDTMHGWTRSLDQLERLVTIQVTRRSDEEACPDPARRKGACSGSKLMAFLMSGPTTRHPSVLEANLGVS